MKFFKQTLVGLFLALSTLLAAAHPSHGELKPVSKAEVTKRADQAVVSLVKQNQLPVSWLKKQVADVTNQQTRSGFVWVIRYTNPTETSKATESLYIFFDEFGNFIEGNHSGKI